MKFEDLLSIRWWGTVGLVLILWTIFSDLIKRGVYALLGLFFKKWGDRNEENVRQLNREIQFTLRNQANYDAYVRAENRQRQKATYYTLLSILFIGIACLEILSSSRNWIPVFYWPFSDSRDGVLVWLIFSIAFGCFLGGLTQWRRAGRNDFILRRADSLRPHVKVSENEK
jgi:hypothetical protein